MATVLDIGQDCLVQSACETADVGVLFEVHHDRIYRYILRMSRSPAEAEELTQETFLRACRHRDALRDPQAVRGWLYRIATNACLDRLRQRRPTVSLESSQGAVESKLVVATSPSALDIAEREETSLCVQRCLDFLPDHYRAAILLYEAHSLTAREIADLLGLKLTTVKMRLHRAHEMLQAVMECGCQVSNGSHGAPTCEPKPDVVAGDHLLTGRASSVGAGKRK